MDVRTARRYRWACVSGSMRMWLLCIRRLIRVCRMTQRRELQPSRSFIARSDYRLELQGIFLGATPDNPKDLNYWCGRKHDGNGENEGWVKMRKESELSVSPPSHPLPRQFEDRKDCCSTWQFALGQSSLHLAPFSSWAEFRNENGRNREIPRCPSDEQRRILSTKISHRSIIERQAFLRV